jgi:hypothetical protein
VLLRPTIVEGHTFDIIVPGVEHVIIVCLELVLGNGGRGIGSVIYKITNSDPEAFLPIDDPRKCWNFGQNKLKYHPILTVAVPIPV